MAYQDIFKAVNKTAAAMLTPQAQQAAMQPPPQDPAAMGGMPPGAPPMDPSMMGAPPMDPAMAGGMPPQGAPMDPSMMGAPAGAPMGQPGAWMQDPMFMQFLQSMGVQVQPDGTAIDPNGQPVPPEMMEQIYAQFQQQMAAQQGGMPPEGAPAEGMPPEGAPMEGAPAEGEMPPEDPAAAQEDMMNQMAGMMQDIIDSTLEQKMSVLDKKISAFADKLDTIKMLLDDMLKDSSAAEKAEKAEDAKIDDDIANDLASAQEGAPVELAPTEAMLAQGAPAVAPAGNMLDIMRGNAQ